MKPSGMSLSRILLVCLLTSTSAFAADSMIYMISGTGSGYYGGQSFTNAPFAFTFFLPFITQPGTAPCCSGTLTTWAGTAGAMTITGVGSEPFSSTADNQAVFVNRAESTAGIWHYNSPDFLTIGNPAFATWDMTTSIGPLSGTTFSYATPIKLGGPLSGGGGETVYFTSVSDVTFTAHRSSDRGQPSITSLSPNNGSSGPKSTTTFTFRVADTAGAYDLQGMNILFSDPVSRDSYACWMWYNRATYVLSMYDTGRWISGRVGAGPNGTTLSGNECSVDTSSAAAFMSGTALTLTLPIHFNIAAGTVVLPIYMRTATNEGTDTGYQQAGQFTINPTSEPGFTVSLSPNPQPFAGIRIGDSISYTLTVNPYGGFNEAVNFSAASSALHNTTTAPLHFNFNPTSVTGAGSTTLTISADSSNAPDLYSIQTLEQSPSASSTYNFHLAVANAPPAVSIYPYPGSGSNQVFTIVANDYDTAANISGANLLFAATLDGRNACWVFWDGTNNELWLADDDASTWISAGRVGSANTASNSQCTVGGTEGKVFLPNSLSHPNTSEVDVYIPVSFQPGFSGTKSIFVRAGNREGFDSGYQTFGTWSVP
jgi:hypothetical protein